MIAEEVVDEIDRLMYQLNILPNHYIFRGQSNADWSLQSSLERMLGSRWNSSIVRNFEMHSIETFKSRYHIYSGREHMPKSKLSWLSVMQHYGVPTRLIDFTTSPYIALYFALESYDPNSGRDFSIYILDYGQIMSESIAYIKAKDSKFNDEFSLINYKQDALFEETVDRYSYDIAWITEPMELNGRIDRQDGTFLISGNLANPIEDILSSEIYSNVVIKKLRIKSYLYEGVYVALRKMGINSKTMYGDLAGLAKSIRMDFQSHLT